MLNGLINLELHFSGVKNQFAVVVVVVAHIYPPVTGQRQMLRTLFITRTNL